MNRKYNNFLLNCIWQIYGERELLDKNMVESTEDVSFEGEVYAAPSKYKEILSSIYGNYMELPPESERIGHHDYKAFLVEED